MRVAIKITKMSVSNEKAKKVCNKRKFHYAACRNGVVTYTIQATFQALFSGTYMQNKFNLKLIF